MDKTIRLTPFEDRVMSCEIYIELIKKSFLRKHYIIQDPIARPKQDSNAINFLTIYSFARNNNIAQSSVSIMVYTFCC